MIQITHLSKSFGGVRALSDVSLTVDGGTIHGLLGHNGSGKSTLIKVLAGYHDPDSGSRLEVRGQAVELPLRPQDAPALGFGFVHQDLGLMPSLSVVENLRVRELTKPRRMHISWPNERDAARGTMEKYGVYVDPRSRIGDLRPWDRAAVAIARAIEQAREVSSNGLIVLDEVTAFLPKERRTDLYRIIRNIADSGSSVLFVSHDLDEALEVTDRVTVIRDGRVAKTVETKSVTKAVLLELIVGGKVDVVSSRAAPKRHNETVAAIRGLTSAVLRDVSFDVGRREILGITGVLGSGFDDLPYYLFGARRARGGEIRIGGRVVALASLTPGKAIALGIRLSPGDRLNDGLIGGLSITDNVTISIVKEFFQHLLLRRRRMASFSRDVLRRFHVRPAERPRMLVTELSGGNQQKVLIAKAAQGVPRLLVLHEPTSGVDVGARQEIFRLIRAATETGAAAIVASADHDQLATICDRVLIFRSGKIADELTTHITKAGITTACYGAEVKWPMVDPVNAASGDES